MTLCFTITNNSSPKSPPELPTPPFNMHFPASHIAGPGDITAVELTVVYFMQRIVQFIQREGLCVAEVFMHCTHVFVLGVECSIHNIGRALAMIAVDSTSHHNISDVDAVAIAEALVEADDAAGATAPGMHIP
jgi:hypothetical protein